jgi:hypothetical protein
MKKNSLKKLASLVGVASISAFFSFPAFALINPSNNISNTVTSGNELLAQNQPGSDNSPTPRTNTDDRAMPTGGQNSESMPTGGQNPGSMQAPTAAPTNTNTPGTLPSLPPEKTTTGNKPGVAGETSLQRGSWFCLNNPNPQCGG